jgi:very-short-patch-repair endonuclease
MRLETKKIAKNPKAARVRRAKRKSNAGLGKNDKWEVELLRQLSSRTLPAPTRELTFHPGRRWRFDMAWPRVKLAVEVEGGIHIGGRHVTAIGFTKDCEKVNQAQQDGWLVLRYVPEHIKSGYAVEQIAETYRQKLLLTSIIEYGEEVFFGDAEGFKNGIDSLWASRRDGDKLAGLLIGSINERGGEPGNPGEDGDHGAGAPHVISRSVKKRISAQSGRKPPADQ